MATDLATRKSSKSEAYLQRKFAELCARIKRVDVFAHLLVLALTLFTYALFVGCLDWFAGSSTATSVQITRWGAYLVFLLAVGFTSVQTMRCCLRRVNPYYVAHQIEQSVPGAKNSLINWLDLHEQGLPPAFQKNLSTVAAEQLEECDVEPMVRKRKNWILLGILGASTLGLAILLLLGPSAFFSSMLRAFLPFYTPAPAARTLLTLLSPDADDAEVGPAQAVNFVVKIEGRVPSGKAKPTLHYRWNADDDFIALPLQGEGADVWSAQLLPAQLRSGVTYKITAGDAATPEYQVRTRAAAHVQKFEIKYVHRPFRQRKDSTSVFPDDRGTRPIIHGPLGSVVELTIHASRSVKTASVEITTKHGKKEPPISLVAGDPRAFTCRFTLEQPGQFRVAFSTPDGEDNADRDAYPILVTEDDAPKVVLTQPGTDVSLPENGTLTLAGAAVSPLGVKGLTLHLRIIEGPDQSVVLLPQPFRPGVSFQFPDGSYPQELAYQDFVALDQFKNAKGTIRLLRPGNVIEYWLEAADAADYPNPTGNIGRSQPYKVTLLPRAKDSASELARRAEAKKQREDFQQEQDKNRAQKNPEKNGSSGAPNPQKSLEQIQQEQKNANDKLDNAKKEQQQNQKAGAAKGADQKNADKKDGPQNPGDAPQPKPAPMSPPDGAGDKKEQGEGQGASGESRGDGEPQKKQDDSGKGEKKEGSKEGSSPGKDSGGKEKQEPAGGARDGGPMGKNGPDPAPAKDNNAGADAPMPSAKNTAEPMQMDAPPKADAKGIEKNGPDVPNKDQQTAANPMQPPDGQAKPGKMNDPGDSGASKEGPANQENPGQARGDDPKTAPPEPSPGDLARHLPNLPRDDQAGDAAGKAIALIAKNTNDPDLGNLAKDILAKNGRDPKTGAKTGEKVPNPAGTLGQSQGIGDDIKAAAANREFAARIGQMQLDDWKKRLTPDLLKKAGMTPADWERYVKNQQTYDALVRQMNAEAAKKALKELSKGKSSGAAIRTVEGPAGSDALQWGNAPPPAELIPAFKRQAEREKK